MSYELLCYQRQTLATDLYSEKLAWSMHLALKEKGAADFAPLNHNFGVLFVAATADGQGKLTAKSLLKPWLVQQDETFFVFAIRINADGTKDEASKGAVVPFTTSDFVHYTQLPLLKISDNYLQDIQATYQAGSFLLSWQEEDGAAFSLSLASLAERDATLLPRKKLVSWDTPTPKTAIEGALPRNSLEISTELGNYLSKKLTTPRHVENEYPQAVHLESLAQLSNVQVTATYSDGTIVNKKVDWFTENSLPDDSGVYNVQGKVHQDHYPFPIAWDRADPCIGKWQGYYYFIATNDADHNHSLAIKRGKTIPELVTAQEIKILDSDMYDHIGNLLWAPEFHIIEGRLCIFHAATPAKFENEQSHVMRLKENGNPMLKSDWEVPRRVVKKDNSPLIEGGITLDMTVIQNKGRHFVVWSQRQLFPDDLGAWLYIAEIDGKEPWKLITDPIVLARPTYGWENNHTFVVEGPYALKRGKKIYLTYSGAAVDATYCVGLLTIDADLELLNPQNWVKNNYPLLSSLNVEGEYGPGHNAYVTDEEGNVWNTYHARPGISAPRSSGIRRVHFDIDDEPVLDVTEEKDLNPELTIVATKVTLH